MPYKHYWKGDLEMSLESFRAKPYRSKRLQSYFSRMSKDNLNPLFDDVVASVLDSQGFNVTESPRSIYKVDKLYDALEKYAPSASPFIKVTPAVRAGVRLAYKCFAKPQDVPYLEPMPLTADTVMQLTSNNQASAGLTAYGETKAQSQVRALNRAKQILSGEKAPEPCLAFKRTQFNDKTRLVWGYPYSMTILEGIFARPLINQFKGGSTPMAFAMSNLQMGTRLRVSSYQRRYCYSLDMSSFDSSIAAYLINEAFGILSTWFNWDELITEPWDVVVNYFITAPIVMPNGKIYHGRRHGVPSGSYFTQIIDSIVNVILAGAVSYEFDLGINRRSIMVLGDDLIFWSNKRVSLNAIAKFARSSLCINVHGSEKSAIFKRGDIIHYLGRDWDNGIPTLDVEKVLQRALYPETFRRYSKDRWKREKEARLMLWAMAQTYKSFYPVLQKILLPSDWYACHDTERSDISLFENSLFLPEVSHLSGNLRYRYMFDESLRERKVANLW